MSTPSYFMSYSRRDEDAALRFAGGLRSAAVNVWVDQWDIKPSQHWDRAIEQAVRTCDGLLVLLSPNSAASENVADEISFALDHGKKVIPILLARCTLPLRVTRMQLIDATNDLDRAIQSCVGVINGDNAVARSEPASTSTAQLDPAAIDRVEQRLRPWLGPMTRVVVSRAAAHAHSEADLHSAVARHIGDAKERARFEAFAKPDSPASSAPLSPTPSETQAIIAPIDIERLANLLTTFLGPMARALVRREGRLAASIDDLEVRLSGLIPDAGDRAAFLRRATGSGGRRLE